MPILWIGKLRQGKIEQGHSACMSHGQGLNLDLGVSQVHALNQFTRLLLRHPLPDQGTMCPHTLGGRPTPQRLEGADLSTLSRALCLAPHLGTL